nr:hybrid signal transduction histidine kinase M [Tanacetum cinerariifolium]
MSHPLLDLYDPLGSITKEVVVARSNTAKAAWTLLTDIVKDNKRSRTFSLKAEFPSIKLGTLSMEAYFQKIDSLVTILTSLGFIVNDEDVVHYAVEGLPEKYNQVCGYMHYQDTFLDLMIIRSLLIMEEMRLKSKADALLMDFSSPMALMTESRNPRRSSSTPQVKPWKPCFHFAKGTCRFRDGCRFVHDANMKNTNNHGVVTKESTTDELFAKLLERLGMNNKLHAPFKNTSKTTRPSTVQHVNPTAYYASPTSGPHYNPSVHYGSQSNIVGPPPGFRLQPPGPTIPVRVVGPTAASEQATVLPNAFTGKLYNDLNAEVSMLERLYVASRDGAAEDTSDISLDIKRSSSAHSKVRSKIQSPLLSETKSILEHERQSLEMVKKESKRYFDQLQKQDLYDQLKNVLQKFILKLKGKRIVVTEEALIMFHLGFHDEEANLLKAKFIQVDTLKNDLNDAKSQTDADMEDLSNYPPSPPIYKWMINCHSEIPVLRCNGIPVNIQVQEPLEKTENNYKQLKTNMKRIKRDIALLETEIENTKEEINKLIEASFIEFRSAFQAISSAMLPNFEAGLTLVGSSIVDHGFQICCTWQNCWDL